MAISRMLQPRQQYGLGSFVKSAVKGVTGAVKGVAGGIKDIIGSDVGKLALLGGALYLGGGTGGISSLFGKAKSFLGGLPGASAVGDYLSTKGGKTLLMAGAGSLLGGLAAKAEEGDPEAVAATRDVGALRNYLTEGYKNLGYAEAEIPALVEKDVSEYSQDRARVGAAYGGRMQYGLGDLVRKSASFTAVPNEEASVPSGGGGFGGMIAKLIQNNPQLFKATNQESTQLSPEEILQIMSRNTFSNGSDDKSEMAKRVEELMDDGYTFGEAVKEIMKEGLKNGGRPGFAMGNKAEQNSINAAGIMGLPLNENPAGVTELDLRETGGFIAPVGVKEKADDIPAMLSNNEFVMTADAVRNMGDGNVNKGAQRMYDMMKALEKRVV